jgi:hypothetical protein
MGLRVGVEEGQAMILSLETLLPSRNSRFLTQINRIVAGTLRYFHNLNSGKNLKN